MTGAERSVIAEIRSMPSTAWAIFAGMFINKFGNFLNVFLILYLTGKGYSAVVAGVALAVVGLGNLAGNILGGLLADHLGRQKTIVISMLGSGLLTIAVPYLGNIVATICLLGGVGVFAQLQRPAAGALLVDSVQSHQRLTAFATYRFALNVGMAVGPAVGGLLSEHSYKWMFLGDGLTSLAYAAIALTVIKDVARADDPKIESAAEAKGYGVVLRDVRYLAYLLAMVAATYVYIQSTATLPLHVSGAGLSNETFGLLLGLNALLVIIFELPLTRFTGRFPALPVISAGLVLLAGGMASTGLATTVAGMAVTVAVWTFAEMIYTPVANAYPGEVAPGHARGRYQGAEGLAHTLGATLGPAVGGACYALSPTLNWVVCAIVALVGAVLVLLARAVGPNAEAGEHLAADEAATATATVTEQAP